MLGQPKLPKIKKAWPRPTTENGKKRELHFRTADAAPGRATLPPAPARLCTRHPAHFSPAGSRCPHEASDPRALGPAGAPASGQSHPGLAFPEKNRLEMRAPTTGTWKIQSVPPPSPALSAEFAANAGPAADPRQGVRHPNPPERGRVGSRGWGHRTRRALQPPPRQAEPGARQLHRQLPGSPRGTCGVREREAWGETDPTPGPAAPTPCCPQRAGQDARRGRAKRASPWSRLCTNPSPLDSRLPAMCK